jgi:hypothetical protein
MKSVSANRFKFAIFSLAFLSVVTPFIVFSTKAQALELQAGYIRINRMQAGTSTGGEVCAQIATTGTITTVEVEFPAGDGSTTGFTVNTTAGNWTVTTTNIDAGSTAWPSIATASAVSGQTVTFSMGAGAALTSGTLYCFNFSGVNTLASRNTAANNLLGTITTKNGGSAVDTKTFSLVTVTSDQIIVTAQVSPTLTFTLSGTAAAFTAPLTSAAVTSTNPITGTIGTNAANGWIAYVIGTNDDGGGYSSLYSVSSAQRIAKKAGATINDTPEDLSSGPGYGVNVSFTDSATSLTGTVSQAAGYGAEYANGATTVGTLSTAAFQPIAASTGPTDSDTVVLTGRAKITSLQPAANDYGDTWTVVVAARY